MNALAVPIESREYVVTLLSAVHVGTGREWTTRLDIPTDSRGRRMVLDLDRVLSQVSDPDRFVTALGAQPNAQALLNALSVCGVRPETASRWLLTGPFRASALREQIRNADGRPLLPGSSVKGAIRTVVLGGLYGVLQAEGSTARIEAAVRDALERARGGQASPADSAQDVEAKALAPFAPGRGERPNRDLLRAVRIVDAAFEGGSERIAEVEVRTPSGGASATVAAEAIARGATSRLRIVLDRDLLRRGAGSLWPSDRMLDLSQIAAWSRAQALRALEDEASWERAAVGGVAPWTATLRAEVAGLPSETIVLRVGWGIGWLGTTGGFLSQVTRQRIREIEWRGGPTRTWDRSAFPKTRRRIARIWRREQDGAALAHLTEMPALGWIALTATGAAAPTVKEGLGPALEAGSPPRTAGPPTRRGPGPRRSGPGPSAAEPAPPRAGISRLRRGATIECVVAEERTAKGKLKFRPLQGGAAGPIAPQSRGQPPADLAPGTRVRLKVFSDDPKNPSFEWIEQATPEGADD